MQHRRLRSHEMKHDPRVAPGELIDDGGNHRRGQKRVGSDPHLASRGIGEKLDVPYEDRLGSLGDMSGLSDHIRFIRNSGHRSGHGVRSAKGHKRTCRNTPLYKWPLIRMLMSYLHK